MTAIKDMVLKTAKNNKPAAKDVTTVIKSVKDQKAEFIAKNHDSFNAFCVDLAAYKYAIAVNKSILIDKGMSDDEFKILSALLTTLRTTLAVYAVCDRENRESPTAEHKKAYDKAENNAFTALKNIKAVFGIKVKSTSADVAFLSANCITFKYADRTQIGKGYKPTIAPNMRILNTVFKLQSLNVKALTDSAYDLVMSRTQANATNTLEEYDKARKAIKDKAAKTSKTAAKTTETAK